MIPKKKAKQSEPVLPLKEPSLDIEKENRCENPQKRSVNHIDLTESTSSESEQVQKRQKLQDTPKLCQEKLNFLIISSSFVAVLS